MIKITEENLKNGINMGLGSEGIWTPELSEHILNEILALRQLAVSVSMLNELLEEFQKYQEQIADTKTITDNQYRLMSKAIWGCKQIAKKVLSNDR